MLRKVIIITRASFPVSINSSPMEPGYGAIYCNAADFIAARSPIVCAMRRLFQFHRPGNRGFLLPDGNVNAIRFCPAG